MFNANNQSWTHQICTSDFRETWKKRSDRIGIKKGHAKKDVCIRKIHRQWKTVDDAIKSQTRSKIQRVLDKMAKAQHAYRPYSFRSSTKRAGHRNVA
jgi:hypothetical protein